MHDAALDAFPTAVNQADFGEPGLVCGVNVVGHDRLHVTRMEGVEIEGVFDGKGNRIVHGICSERPRRPN
jgi:hypothetical protein